MVELDYPVDISEVSRVMENLLLSFAEQLMRYKGMLWIDGEPNRLLFQGVQRLYSADWDRPWAMKRRTARWCLSAFSCRKRKFARRLPGYDANLPACALRRRPLSETSSKQGPNVGSASKNVKQRFNK